MSELQDLENELAAVADESLKNADGSAAPSETPPETREEPATAETPTETGFRADDETAKLREALARAQADYKNLSARTERERLEMADYVTEKFVSKLLPSVDNLERLLSGTPESERSGALYEGVKSTHAGIVRSLEAAGIVAFESVGHSLDPDFHEAVAQVPGAEGTVVAEFEKGYKLRDKVIRHAKVTVGNGG